MAAAPVAKQETKETPAQEAFRGAIEKQYEALARGRVPEEHEWFENGLFHQLRQWLERDPVTRRIRPLKFDPEKAKPMPVTNHFSKAINRNANALGANIPDMRALPDNYDAKNRRAAEAAERAIIQANRESGFEKLNTTLAQMVVIYGISATKDTIDMSAGAEAVQSVQPQEVTVGYQCGNCGYSEFSGNAPGAEAGPAPAGGTLGAPGNGGGAGQLPAPVPSGQQPAPTPAGGMAAPGGQQGQPQQHAGVQPCPRCGAPMQPITDTQDLPGEQTNVPVSRLKTELLSPFEIYVPRDCGDPNLSPLKIQVSRKRVAEAKSMFPDIAGEIKADGDKKGSNLALFYLNSLRRLMTAGSSPQEDEADQCTIFEAWCKWNWLDEDVQKAIEAEWGDQPSEHPTYSAKGMTKLEAAIAFGVFGVFIGPLCAQMGEAPQEEGDPYTFFVFQKDIASPYPKGLGVEIKPLQKQINRIDSIMTKMGMTGIGKWIIPLSQARTKPTGDPGDIVQWDDDAGKAKPEFVSATPQLAALAAMRARIVQEFDELANTSSVDSGQAGATTGPFRALAYLGSKAEESRQTTRYLWESSHEIRARKLLELAKLAWDEPRKVKVTGLNNRSGVELLDVADLGNGSYAIEVIQDSSRPKTVDEKIQTISTLLQAGMLNVQDPSVRDYIFATFGMNEVDPANHVSYAKAERDLESIKNGIPPQENPFMNWMIELLIFKIYIQTEEFESLDPQVQANILMWAGYCEMQGQMQAMGAPQGPPPGGSHAGQALAGKTPGQTLHGVAGHGVSPMQQQSAAATEGQQVVDALPQEQSTVQ